MKPVGSVPNSEEKMQSFNIINVIDIQKEQIIAQIKVNSRAPRAKPVSQCSNNTSIIMRSS